MLTTPGSIILPNTTTGMNGSLKYSNTYTTHLLSFRSLHHCISFNKIGVCGALKVFVDHTRRETWPNATELDKNYGRKCAPAHLVTYPRIHSNSLRQKTCNTSCSYREMFWGATFFWTTNNIARLSRKKWISQATADVLLHKERKRTRSKVESVDIWEAVGDDCHIAQFYIWSGLVA